jgi:hypothetical protein
MSYKIIFYILNMGITWISWGAAPGYINIAPLGLEDNYLNYFCFPKSPVCSLLEYITNLVIMIELSIS